METLDIKCTDEKGASEKTQDEVCPGHPFIVFSAKPSVAVVLDNPTPRSGLFTIKSEITNGDTTKTFNDKIAKIIGIKGNHTIANMSLNTSLHILMFTNICRFGRFANMAIRRFSARSKKTPSLQRTVERKSIA